MHATPEYVQLQKNWAFKTRVEYYKGLYVIPKDRFERLLEQQQYTVPDLPPDQYGEDEDQKQNYDQYDQGQHQQQDYNQHGQDEYQRQDYHQHGQDQYQQLPRQDDMDTAEERIWSNE